MSLSFQHWVAGTCPEILHVCAYSAEDVLLGILCMTQKVVRTRGQWPDSGMLVFKKSDWGEVYMMPMSMEWVMSGVDGDWKARVFIVWITYMDRDNTQNGSKSWRREEHCGPSTSLSIGMIVSCVQPHCPPKKKAYRQSQRPISSLTFGGATPEVFSPGSSQPFYTPTVPEPLHRVNILRRSCGRCLTMTISLLLEAEVFIDQGIKIKKVLSRARQLLGCS